MSEQRWKTANLECVLLMRISDIYWRLNCLHQVKSSSVIVIHATMFQLLQQIYTSIRPILVNVISWRIFFWFCANIHLCVKMDWLELCGQKSQNKFFIHYSTVLMMIIIYLKVNFTLTLCSGRYSSSRTATWLVQGDIHSTRYRKQRRHLPFMFMFMTSTFC